jgi:ligand-binding SRPBCC domain-containing protein
MANGLEIDYVVRPLKFPMRWTSRITAYDPPRMFVDEQIRGPYRVWRHTHRFISVPGGTWIDDEVEYVLPFGLLGRLLHWAHVRRQLNNIFSYREKIIGDVFGLRRPPARES